MRTRWLIGALLFAPGAAHAQAAIRVQPLAVDVIAPSQAGSITLQNNGKTDLGLQVRIFEWTQLNGEDALAPTSDVVASPPATKIPPGGTYTVRVARTAGAVTTGERAYRVWVDELPPAGPPRTDGGEVNVRLRYDLPAFFHAPGTATKLNWRAFRSGETLVVEASNTGNRHARIEKLSVEGPQGEIAFGKGPLGYVLPGATRRWVAPAGVTLPVVNANVTVVAGVSGSESRLPVTIAGN
jgi:fimbrial chaperone protein